MKRKELTILLSTVMILAMGGTAFAAEWKKDGNGWWWQEDNGSYPAGTWQWVDGNGDGVSECYYFNDKGYCLQNTSTPDGYTVDSNGAWVIDGVIQTKGAAPAAVETAQEAASQYQDDYSGVYEVPFYEMDGSVTTQTLNIVYDGAANAIVVTYPRLGITQTYTYAGLDYRGVIFFELVSEEEKDAIFFVSPGIIEWPADEGSVAILRK